LYRWSIYPRQRFTKGTGNDFVQKEELKHHEKDESSAKNTGHRGADICIFLPVCCCYHRAIQN
jgi:hypothetical protein